MIEIISSLGKDFFELKLWEFFYFGVFKGGAEIFISKNVSKINRKRIFSKMFQFYHFSEGNFKPEPFLVSWISLFRQPIYVSKRLHNFFLQKKVKYTWWQEENTHYINYRIDFTIQFTAMSIKLQEKNCWKWKKNC